jgi:hypothetical protein
VNVLGSILESVLRAYWERTVKHAGSVPSSAIGTVLESMPGSVPRLYSEVWLGAYLECTWDHLESYLGSVWSSRLAVCHRVQLGASLRACLGVY